MAELLGLPDELLVSILLFLDDDSLHCAASTCRRLWHVAADNELWRLRGLSRYAFLPPAPAGTAYRRLVLSLQRGMALRWRSLAGECWRAGAVHTRSIWTMCGTEHILATACMDGRVRVFDMRQVGQARREDDGAGLPRGSPAQPRALPGPHAELSGHTRKINAMALSANARTIISASTDATLRAWSLSGSSAGLARAVVQLEGSGLCVDMPAHGCVLAGTHERVVHRVDVEAERVVRTFRGHSGAVLALAANPTTASLFVSGAHDRRAILWDEREAGAGASRVLGMHAHEDDVCSVLWADEQTCVVASADAHVRVYDVRRASRTPLVDYTGHRGAVQEARLVPGRDGAPSFLITSSSDQTARRWDWRTGHAEVEYAGMHSDWVLGFHASAEHGTLTTISLDGTAVLWDLDSGMPHWQVPCGRQPMCMFGCESMFAVGTRYGELFLVDFKVGARQQPAHVPRPPAARELSWTENVFGLLPNIY